MSTEDERDAAATLDLEIVRERITVLRGHNVMLDSDLAALYGVEVRALVQAVKRNIERFPEDFMFQLDASEAAALRSQAVISKIEASSGRGGRRTTPYAHVTADEQVDTSTPLGKAMAQMRGVFAELERGMAAARTREGMAAAKAKGVRLGRPPVGWSIVDGEMVHQRSLCGGEAQTPGR